MLVCVGVYRSQEVAAQEAHAKVSSEQPYVTAKLLADTTAIQAGKPFKLGVELSMKSGWHTYYKESGDAGLPSKITWKLPPGFVAGPILWEKPSKFNDSGIVTYGYKDKTLIGATITPPADFNSNKIEFKADVKWLSCAEICVPGGTSVSLSMPVDKTGSVAASANTEEFSKLGFEGSVKDLTLDGSSKVSSAVPSAENATNPRAPDGVSVLNQKFTVEGSAEKPQSLLAYLALAFVGGMNHFLLHGPCRGCNRTASDWTQCRLGIPISVSRIFDRYVRACSSVCDEPIWLVLCLCTRSDQS